jgi:phosphoglycerate kinase
MKTLDDFNFKDKKALIRVDFNVPLNENLEVTDATRIQAAKPTIMKVLEDGGSAVLMSHLGRPKGVEEKYSLRHIAKTVTDILGVQVKFAENCVGEVAERPSPNCKMGKFYC